MLKTAQLYEVENYIRIYKKTKNKLKVPVRYTVPDELKELGEEIVSVSGTWNPVEILTPDGNNSAQEKSNFFNAYMDNKIYNPNFTYNYAKGFDVQKNRNKMQACKDSLEKFHPKIKLHRMLKYALDYKISDDFATCDLIEGIQNKWESKIAMALDQKYADSDYDLYLLSLQEYYKNTQKLGKKKSPGILSDSEKVFMKSLTFHAEDIKSAFEWALNQYGLLKSKNHPNGYQVIIDNKATSIDVRDKSINGPSIFIPKNRTAKADKLLSLIAHEIEGHVRQSMNGHDLFIIGGGALKIDDEMLYEGLAKRYDEAFRMKFFGATEVVPHPYYTFAIHKVQRGFSFHEIFNEQLNMRLHVKLKIKPDAALPPFREIDRKLLLRCMDNSWNTTLRVMRGHRDTTNPRGFSMTKDISYLRGWLVDKQLCQLGYGHINEAAIMTCQRGLEFMAQFDVSEKDLPYPYKDVTTKYWEQILKPLMKKNYMQSAY